MSIDKALDHVPVGIILNLWYLPALLTDARPSDDAEIVEPNVTGSCNCLREATATLNEPSCICALTKLITPLYPVSVSPTMILAVELAPVNVTIRPLSTPANKLGAQWILTGDAIFYLTN